MIKLNVRKNTLDKILQRYTVLDNGCWEYLGAKSTNGYCQVSFNGKQRLAHRIFYEAFTGEISEALQLDHLCKNRSCVNPEHLEQVTQKENWLRGDSPTAINIRKTHCLRGHEYTEQTTYFNKLGYRECRICIKNRYKAKKNIDLPPNF